MYIALSQILKYNFIIFEHSVCRAVLTNYDSVQGEKWSKQMNQLGNAVAGLLSIDIIFSLATLAGDVPMGYLCPPLC